MSDHTAQPSQAPTLVGLDASKYFRDFLRSVQDRDTERAREIAAQLSTLYPGSAIGPYCEGLTFYAGNSFAEAAEALMRACEAYPFFDAGVDLLIETLVRAERISDAEAVCRAHEIRNPGSAEMRYRLATFALARGEFETAKSWYDLALNSPRPARITRMLPHGVVSAARVRHDRLQLARLIGLGILDRDFEPALRAYEVLDEQLSEGGGPVQLESADVLVLSRFYRRCIHLEQVAVGSDLFGGWNPRRVEARFLASGSAKLVVIDDFLSPQSLDDILRYLINSTIWHNDGQKGLHYIGAYENSGLRMPVINRIAECLPTLMPKIFGGLRNEQMWAYKQVFQSSGIGVHADFAKVNVNVWLTPDIANMDCEGGGLLIYPVATPERAAYEEYNGDVGKIESLIKGVAPIVIPYRQNRAVVFDSGLFHGSQSVRFKEDYESMRMNMTMLYGTRFGGA